MNLKRNTTFRPFVCLLLVCLLCMSVMPTAFAAQEDGYYDPAEHWQTADNCTAELDANAVVTRETYLCGECGKASGFTVFRTPEYTTDGNTALSRNLKYSDGTMPDGEGKGVILDGTPGVNAYYTGCHFTKAVCETCGGINTNLSGSDYGYQNNVYWLNECAAVFMEDLEETVSYEYADAGYHTKIIEGGEYCRFCYGTKHTRQSVLEAHDMTAETVITNATCTGEGVTQYACADCSATKLECLAATGHTPGETATCTQPQLCTECGAVIANALGHDYTEEVTAPTCTTMGYTTHTCSRCGDSYRDAYTEATGHKAGEWIVDEEPTTTSEGSRHTECVNCGETLETQTIEKLSVQAATDSEGKAAVGAYLVTVTDTDSANPLSGAMVTLNQGAELNIVLPSDRLLDYADQITVTAQKDESAVSNVTVTVTDQNGGYATAVTDSAGQITLPGSSGETNSNGKATVGCKDADGNRVTLTVQVADYETGRSVVGANVSADKTGGLTVTLPDGVDLDESNRITVTVTNNEKEPLEGQAITVKGDLGQSISGTTDADGKVTVPAAEVETTRHSAYIVGYPDGSFGPDRNMTRAEAAVIFARLLADKNGDVIYDNVHCSYSDVSGKAWYAGYVKYLETFGVASGYEDGTYRPNEAITRAEFVTMAVRFFAAYGMDEEIALTDSVVFSDVESADWAADYIRQAAASGWVIGYADGTFGGDTEISRAEVVTIVGRVLGREADTEYLAANRNSLTAFSDVPETHWAYAAVTEAANAHTAPVEGTESWLHD